MPSMNENSTTLRPGLVVSYHGNSVAVEAEDGQVFHCLLLRNQALPVVGDEVLWRLEDTETGRVQEIKPRRSLLSRGDMHGKLKPLAANVDAILIVMAPAPIFSEYLVDRYIVAAELLDIEPIIVINKADLMDAELQATMAARLRPYKAMNYQVVYTSALTEAGLQSLTQILASKNAVLVGPSGVGKSSIIARLGHFEAIQIGEVSKKGTGKHTTTATRLYHLPGGGNLIDSPGVREFNLWPVTPQELLRGFRDISAHIGGCRFRDCSHRVEPGCAVQAAVAGGEISKERFTSYKTLLGTEKNDKYSS